jgi:hypothetical protein
VSALLCPRLPPGRVDGEAVRHAHGEGMWVLAGSKGRPELLSSARDRSRKERKALQRLNVISVDEHERWCYRSARAHSAVSTDPRLP